MTPLAQPKMSAFKRARYLASAATATLKADKEIMVFPVISSILSLLLTASVFSLVFFTGTRTGSLSVDALERFSWQGNPWVMWPAFIVGYIINVAIIHFIEAMIYSAVQQRFAGNDPSLKTAYVATRKKIRPLLLFSVMMATVGLALQALEERVPFAGKIAVWLFSAAWSIANVFAIPVILTEKESVTPIAATKKSVGLIKKVWGENVIAQFGIGLIAILWIFVASILTGLTGAVLTALSVPESAATIASLSFFILACFAIITVVTTLTTIVKAAVFHYATTGESPETFSKELLRATITPKKSRKLFAAK